MDYNNSKYFVEHSDLLTEAEKVRMAENLLELERRGVLEYSDGRWGLAAGVEIEETSDGPVALGRNAKDAVPSRAVESSTPSSGEPSETRIPPLDQAARPSSEGPGSPDSDDEVSKQ